MLLGTLPFVEVEKVSPSDYPRFLPAEQTDVTIVPAAPGFSLAVGYRIQGWLVTPIVVGESVRILRVSRNGVLAPGIFCSSAVVTCDGARFSTVNSVYRWQIIDCPTSPN